MKCHLMPKDSIKQFIGNCSPFTTTELSTLLLSCITAVKSHIIRYCETVRYGYLAADLHLCLAYAKSRFSHDTDQVVTVVSLTLSLMCIFIFCSKLDRSMRTSHMSEVRKMIFAQVQPSEQVERIRQIKEKQKAGHGKMQKGNVQANSSSQAQPKQSKASKKKKKK